MMQMESKDLTANLYQGCMTSYLGAPDFTGTIFKEAKVHFEIKALMGFWTVMGMKS